jgi:hypothetical protein
VASVIAGGELFDCRETSIKYEGVQNRWIRH